MPGASPAPEPPNGVGGGGGQSRRRRLPRVGISLAILSLLVGLALTVHLHYDVFVPREAPDPGSHIHINGPVQRRAGAIHLTAVGAYYGGRLPQLIAAWRDPTAHRRAESSYPIGP